MTTHPTFPALHANSQERYFSVVTPVYNSEVYLEEFVQRMEGVLRGITSRYEIIFVNDGSSDTSLEKLLALQAANSAITVLDLARNYGQFHAIRTGLAHVKGDIVFTIDCDLEEKPEILTKFYEEMMGKGLDVVFGYRVERTEPWLYRSAAIFFNFLLNVLSSEPVIRHIVTARLMTRQYVEGVLQFRELATSFSTISHQVGFRRGLIPVHKAYKGSTSYTFDKRIRLAANHIFSTTFKPLLFPVYAGILCLIVALFQLPAVMHQVSGQEWLMFSLWLIGGIILVSLGFLGVYLTRVLVEVRQRPLTIIKNVYKSGE